MYRLLFLIFLYLNSSLCSIVSSCSVHVAFGGLLWAFIRDHLLFEADKNLLHGSFRVPVLEKGEFSRLNFTVVLVNAGKIDLWGKAHNGRSHRVVGSALNVEEKDLVVEVGVSRADNSAIPLGERLIISLVKTVGHWLVRKLGVLRSFKLFVEAESSRDYKQKAQTDTRQCINQIYRRYKRKALVKKEPEI